MIIKQPDEKKSQIAALQALQARPDASPEIRKRIEQEIRNIQAGMKGEAEAAYEMDFHFGPSNNHAIIHDLRIECEGRVAQIDHMVINRFLCFWVCESKHFSEGIAINDHGECSAFYGGRQYGVASPFEQNRKHIMVGQLEVVDRVPLPLVDVHPGNTCQNHQPCDSDRTRSFDHRQGVTSEYWALKT